MALGVRGIGGNGCGGEERRGKKWRGRNFGEREIKRRGKRVGGTMSESWRGWGVRMGTWVGRGGGWGC